MYKNIFLLSIIYLLYIYVCFIIHYNYIVYSECKREKKNANKYVAYRKEHDFVEKIVQRLDITWKTISSYITLYYIYIYISHTPIQ